MKQFITQKNCVQAHLFWLKTYSFKAQALTIRWRLREIMARQRMTNKRLAELMGVHPNTISNLKNQDTMPHVGGDMLDALCRYLDCTPHDLIEYTRDRSIDTPNL